MNKTQPVYDEALAISIYVNGGTPRTSLNGNQAVIILPEGVEPIQGMPSATPQPAAAALMTNPQWQNESPS